MDVRDNKLRYWWRQHAESYLTGCKPDIGKKGLVNAMGHMELAITMSMHAPDFPHGSKCIGHRHLVLLFFVILVIEKAYRTNIIIKLCMFSTS